MKKYLIDINDICLIILCLSLFFLMLPSKCHGTTLTEIDRWCEMYEYDNCALVKSIAIRESSLNPLAFHSEKSGSYGLMQIQCDVAKDERLEQPLKYSCDQLFKAQINIRFGIQYLKLVERHLIEKNVKNILAAYNAGFNGKTKKCIKYDTSKDRKKCTQFGFHPRKCKNYNRFKYDGFPVMECFPGEYLNEGYVWKVFRLYRYLNLKHIKEDIWKI